MTSPLNPAIAALSAQHVCLDYGATRVLDDFCLELPAGSVVGLVGRNGAGKSSLLRSFLGLSLPHTGRLTVLGESSAELSDDTRKKLGYVPQQPDLVDWMDVWQHVAYIGSFYTNWCDIRARDLCSRLELPTTVTVKNLSVGDKQKLAIVLALAHDPELLLMDEPVASLDPIIRREFMRTIFDTQQQRTVLISSHLLGDLERFVSHVAFVRAGRMQLFGGWDDLSEHLRIVRYPSERDVPPGSLCQRTVGSTGVAIVDTRVPLFADYADDSTRPTLDDIFVELNA